MSATGGRAGNDNRIKLDPGAGEEQSFPAWGGFTQHFENFAESGEINFEDFVFFGEKKFEERNKALSLYVQISKLWNQRDSLSEKFMTVCSNGSKKATETVRSS